VKKIENWLLFDRIITKFSSTIFETLRSCNFAQNHLDNAKRNKSAIKGCHTYHCHYFTLWIKRL